MGRQQRGRLRIGLPALLALGTTGVAMTAFGIGEVCLFSATRGVVTAGGTPVAGAEVERQATWQGKTRSDRAVTDAEGRFAFEPMTTSSLVKFFPVEPVIEQRIAVRHEGREVEVWETTKRDYQQDSELDGRPLDLRCDLEGEVRYHETRRGVVKGLCDFG